MPILMLVSGFERFVGSTLLGFTTTDEWPLPG